MPSGAFGAAWLAGSDHTRHPFRGIPTVRRGAYGAAVARTPAFVLLLLVAALTAAALADGRPVPGAPACPMTPADSFWHADVSALPVHPQSATWVSSIGATAGLKADFGSGTWDGGPIGIPYTTVPGHPAAGAGVVRLRRRERPRPVPDPAERPDRGRSELAGDRHVLLVDRDACRLWELYSAYPQNGGASWTAGLGRDLEPQLERDAPARLDVRRRRGPADPAGPRPLRRGRRGR